MITCDEQQRGSIRADAIQAEQAGRQASASLRDNTWLSVSRAVRYLWT